MTEFSNPEKFRAEGFFKTAESRLKSVGLTLEDLAHYETVLDIGAKDCAIQKAQEAKGKKT